MLSKKQIFIRKIFVATFLLSSHVYADFGVRSEQNTTSTTNTTQTTTKTSTRTNTCRPYESYLPHSRTYGNAETERFSNAVNGCNRDLTETEENDLLAAMPEQSYDRWCARISINIGKEEFRSLKNKTSIANPQISSQVINTKSVNKNHMGLEFAVGYIAPYWRTELEYLVNTNISYNQTKLFQGIAGGVNSKITGNTILATLYYEFLDPSEFFHPFVSGSVGVSPTKVTTTFTGFVVGGVTNNQEKVDSSYNLAWGGGLGFRVQIYSQLHVQVAARYIRLGRVTIKDKGGLGILKLKGNRNLMVGTLGFLILI
jgi:hypothetical protein